MTCPEHILNAPRRHRDRRYGDEWEILHLKEPVMFVLFAGASLIETLDDSLRALWRRRTGTSTRRDDRVIPFTDAST